MLNSRERQSQLKSCRHGFLMSLRRGSAKKERVWAIIKSVRIGSGVWQCIFNSQLNPPSLQARCGGTKSQSDTEAAFSLLPVSSRRGSARKNSTLASRRRFRIAFLTWNCMLQLAAHTKTKFNWANLGNKPRYIPSGALTGADVQGLGGKNRKGQVEDRSV